METSVPIWLRPGETMLEVRDDRSGMCKDHRVPVVEVVLHLGDRLQSFRCWRHADGTACTCVTHVPDPTRGERLCPDCAGRYTRGLVEVLKDQPSCYLLDRCSTCGAYETLVRHDTGYGTVTTCSGCGDSHYYDRGD